MITAEQRQTRKQFIGSSDAAAILGLDPFKSAADVWLDKTGRAADFEGNEATDRGTLLEPTILSWAEMELGAELVRDVPMLHDNRLLAANLDARLAGLTELVEAKSSVIADEWGDPGTDQVPERVTVQVHHQFVVAGPEWRVAWVPVLLPGFKTFDFRLYRIDRNDELAEMIERSGVDFMQQYVLPDVRPSDFRPNLDVLKRIKRTAKKTISIPSAIVSDWQYARQARLDAEKIEEQAQAAVLAALDDAECGTCDAGEVTYFETKRRAYEVKATSYRSLKLKPSKGE